MQHYIVFGQEQKDTINLKCTTVIAVNGLNIRENPSKSSKIIDKIPFGYKIKYLSQYSFGIDTIKDYSKLGGRYAREQDYKFIGKWAKINYNGKIGYVLDAYLFYDGQTNKVNREDNREYALLYSYNACYTNMYTPSKFIWYGLFKDEKGIFLLKKVKINYFSTENENFGGKDLGVSVGNDKGLWVIIGSKKPMREGVRNCIDIDKMRENDDNILDKNKLKTFGIERLSDNPQDKNYYEFIVKNGNKIQSLNTSVKGREYYPLTHIDFIGDIDGDNKMDYILGSDGEEGYDILFLSSERRGNNIVEPVAYFYSFYCC